MPPSRSRRSARRPPSPRRRPHSRPISGGRILARWGPPSRSRLAQAPPRRNDEEQPRIQALGSARSGSPAARSAVWTSKHDSQLTEVLVERHQYLPARARHGEYALIARIRRPISDPVDIVPRRAQRGHGAAPDAGVEQNLHASADSTSGGSTRSCPTRRLGVHQACTNVVGLQPRVALQENLRSIAGRQHPEHMLDRQTAVPDDWFATVCPGSR